MADTRVNLCGRELDNPVIPASGTFGYGAEFAQLYDLDILGSFVLKSTTLHPRAGNALPRIAETPAGLLNAVGLENPGLAAVVADELPRVAAIIHKPVIANVAGFSVEEYAGCAAEFDRQPQVGWIEVNISCPNVADGGMSFGLDPVSAAAVTAAVKAVTTKPVLVKLTPNAPDIVAVAQACQAAGADGLSLINTLLGRRLDLATGRPILANGSGGLSGPAILPLALQMVHQVAQATSLPIVGIGGVASARDVIEMMWAGASAVQVGSANLVDPYACQRIVADLPATMDELGLATLADLTRAGRS